jgi:tight adherence protein C
LRLVFALLSAWVAYLAVSRGLELSNFLLAALAIYIGVLGPTIWLKRRVRHRQERIRKDLPDALDMLSVCAQAGLGFDQAVQRVSSVWQSSFSTELARLVSEMEMGVPRRQALRNMADRLDVPELSSFVSVIIQSDQLGMSISDTLQAQAKQMRIERRFRAQEAARKVPLKMLFPMILLIFPAMLAVVCGPSIPLILELFQTIRPR